MMIMPMLPLQLSDEYLVSRFYGTQFTISNEKQYLQNVSPVLKSHFASISSVQRQLALWEANREPLVLGTEAFAGLILVISLFGMIGSNLASMLHRQKEFGLRVALGATTREVTIMVVAELLYAFVRAAVFASVITLVLTRTVSTSFTVTGVLLLEVESIAVGIGILVALFPACMIMRFEPVHLIRKL